MRLVGFRRQLSVASSRDNVSGNKLSRSCPREFSANTYSHKVRIFAIIGNPLVELSFISSFNAPGIDLTGAPAMLVPSEAFPESPRVLGRVAERDPDNLGVFISQRTLRNFPDPVCNRRSLVVDDNDAFAFVVQSRECLGIVF